MRFPALDRVMSRRTSPAVRYAPAVIAFVAILVGGLFAGSLNRSLYYGSVREDAQHKLLLIRSNLEGAVQADVQLVRGLVGSLRTEPYMSQQRYGELVGELLGEKTRLRNIAAAPDMVISYMYPMAGNEKAIGLNYLATPDQRETAERARDTGSLVLAGPVNLRQGGQGFIARFPVFVPTSGGAKRFWGIVSAVIDMERLYRDAGLRDTAGNLQFAIRGKDVSGRSGALFFGDQSILDNDPVVTDVRLPSGSWQLAAVPAGGWSTTPPNALFIRSMLALALLMVVGPMILAGRLLGDVQETSAETERRERELNILSRRLQLALEASKIGVWEYSASTNEVVWDERVGELYGRPHKGIARRNFTDWANVVHPDDIDRAMEESEVAIASNSPYSSSYRIVRADGTVRHMRTKAQPYQDVDGLRLVGAEWDVTEDVMLHQDLERARHVAELKNAELEAAKTRIEHNALHDALTGLPNRRFLDQELPAARTVAAGRDMGMLHIDLDRFKQINDTLGHAAGDAMLVHAAGVLKACARPTDVIARIGGDEFVVLAPVDASIAELENLADRIIVKMREPVAYEGHQCRFGVSIGIATENMASGSGTDLMVNADIALYRAKGKGRDRYEIFTEALQSEIVQTKRLADEILAGIERREFVPFYQPQFDARTLKIAGVEALVRWVHPTRGLLAPGEFLRTAEELNVVSTIDRLILEQSVANFHRWEAQGAGIPRISVNVSARRIQDGELIGSLKSLDIRPGMISFELVESIFLDEHDDLIEWNVDRIKDLGIDIEIDDFGTGYASIVSLQKLKPRRLKIDRQLIAPVVKSQAQRKMIGSIIEIGKALDIEIVAEGVETMEHAMILQTIGCDLLQGYALARPMTATQLSDFVRQQAVARG